MPSPSVPNKTEKTTLQKENLVNGPKSSNENTSENVQKSVPPPTRPKLNQSKSLEDIDKSKPSVKIPSNIPVDYNIMNSAGDKPMLPKNSANTNDKTVTENEEIPLFNENDKRTSRNSTDIIVCSSIYYSTIT